MTCIVGLVHEGVTYIGGDSLGSNGYSKVVRKDPKVFHIKDIKNAVIGYTSSFRMGQILMYGTGFIDSRDTYEKEINHQYLVTKFIPNVIKQFEDGGYSKTNSGEKKGGVFLFAYKDNLYKIESDFQVGQSAFNYDACGSGGEFALGSLHSTAGEIQDPVTRIHKALQAASEFSCGVSAPYTILNTKNNDVVTFEN